MENNLPKAVTIEELRNVYALADLSDEHLQWILDRGEPQDYSDGELMIKPGDAIDEMFVTLDGKIDYYVDMNGRQVLFFTFGNDQQTGGVGGLLPYSRMKGSQGYAYSVGHSRLFRLHKKYFHELEELNPDLIQKLIGYMTERARSFATIQLQHEKVNALGKLAAGIAHELNNPAAAINRIAEELDRRLLRNYQLTEMLLSCTITPMQIQHIRNLVESKELEMTEKKRVSAMDRLQMEDDIADWLEQQGYPGFREAAESFAEFGFLPGDFESVRDFSKQDEIIHVIQWLENILSSHRIIKDLDEASGRIFRLVGAIKSHVHMDRTGDYQCTDIHNDLENTLTLLGYKLREKNIEVLKKFDETMPEIEAYIGELNQVWTNIIDNAVYAMDKGGRLIVETKNNEIDVVISLTDNGPGIPKDIISRIFDPFFTTKKVGDGTGIGLDLVNRIIKKHEGEVKVFSEPGRTEFKICLPKKQKELPVLELNQGPK